MLCGTLWLNFPVVLKINTLSQRETLMDYPVWCAWCSYQDEQDENQAADEDVPEERLAFALGDGRWAVLAVKGRKLTETGAKRTSTTETTVTAVAAWNNLVIMGDADGTITRWDINKQKLTTIPTAQVGRVGQDYPFFWTCRWGCGWDIEAAQASNK